MSDVILSASLFNNQPTEETITFNADAVAAYERARAESVAAREPEPAPVQAVSAVFSLLPVSGDWDAEYTKLRGQDVRTIRFRQDAGGKAQVEPLEFELSNQRELAALRWLAKRVVCGWRGIKLDDGSELPYSELNVEKLAAIPQVIRPVIARAYQLAAVRDAAEAGN